MLHRTCLSLLIFSTLAVTAVAGEPDYPPKLPKGKKVVTDQSKDMLKPGDNLKKGVKIAKEAPQVDFLYYPGQTYAGNPWSAWGDSLAVGDKLYSSIGDHKAPQGNAFVYEYDPATQELKQLLDTASIINKPEGHYMPGKIHSRIDMGNDGWLYFSTHRGSTRVTNEKYHYKGDWILRHHPEQQKTEIVAYAPLPNQCMPTSVLDPERLIYYAGTADGDYKNKQVQFLAYDVKAGKLLYNDDFGPYRYIIFSPSTGRIYYHGKAAQQSKENRKDAGLLTRFDPDGSGKPQAIKASLGLRAATQETPDGKVYTVSNNMLYEFDVNKESARELGEAAVANEEYIASIDAGPTGRYLYYVPGAHGGAYRDGTPVVQYDVQKGTRKVLCFLSEYYQEKYGFTPQGTYATAVSPEGDKLYITMNGNRGFEEGDKKRPFNTCALMVVHIPESERSVK